MIMELKGVNGQVELYQDKVVIKRKGLLSKMTQGFSKGDKTIYLRQISGIQVKMGSTFANGYIQFTVPGGRENTKGLMSATQDENTVMFKKSENELVFRMKERIEELLAAQHAPQPMQRIDAAEEIRKFKALLDDGIISQEEFNAKKMQLIG